jgi:hypothetical protein
MVVGWVGCWWLMMAETAWNPVAGDARVHPRLPKIMKTNFGKIISKDFKKNAKPRLGVSEDGGGRRFCGGEWDVVIFGQG